ncbi:MAG: glycosyltransferase [Bacteroidales bacterium]|nr:glycosyltransferase [Bacteroidales bacterium]
MKSGKERKIYVALPVMDEMDYLPEFINNINNQKYKSFELYICVNQPDEWWSNPEKESICLNNKRALKLLKKITQFPVTVIDKSSKGMGWKGKKFGVGWARKTIMDKISIKADKNDIILTLDADTSFSENYLSSISDSFIAGEKVVALSVPYYHKLTEDETTNRNILHYEIYMRYFSLNLWRISNPYRFTALGSAIAVPVWVYKTIGGITPHKSGEDFYFLQKLRKYGKLKIWNNEKVFPAARFSDRVFFGTGPAMIKGKNGNWSSYPFYHFSLFDKIKITFDLFFDLYEKDIETPLSGFLRDQFNSENIWIPLRNNFKTRENFIKACEDKVDGLRILQFLKSSQKNILKSDEENLKEYLIKFNKNEEIEKLYLEEFSFSSSSIFQLNLIRDFLVMKESELQKEQLII